MLNLGLGLFDDAKSGTRVVRNGANFIWLVCSMMRNPGLGLFDETYCMASLFDDEAKSGCSVMSNLGARVVQRI